MIYGHICYNSRKSAREELMEAPSEVVCTNCGEVTELTISDYGFGDAFGGVSDFRVETKCCGGEWVNDCLCCGETKPLKKRTEKVGKYEQEYWYCAECLKEMEAEDENCKQN